MCLKHYYVKSRFKKEKVTPQVILQSNRVEKHLSEHLKKILHQTILISL